MNTSGSGIDGRALLEVQNWLRGGKPWSALSFNLEDAGDVPAPAEAWGLARQLIDAGLPGIPARLREFESGIESDLQAGVSDVPGMDLKWLEEFQARRQTWALARLEEAAPGFEQEQGPHALDLAELRELAEGPLELPLPGAPEVDQACAVGLFLERSARSFLDSVTMPALFVGFGGARGLLERVRISCYDGSGLGRVRVVGARVDRSFQAAVHDAWHVGWAAGQRQNPLAGSLPDAFVWLPCTTRQVTGPSLGLPVAAAAIALATGKQFPSDWAFTGEIEASGAVKPIGGLEKKRQAMASDPAIRFIGLAEADARTLESESIPRPIAIRDVSDLIGYLADPLAEHKALVASFGDHPLPEGITGPVLDAVAKRNGVRQVVIAGDAVAVARALAARFPAWSPETVAMAVGADLVRERSLEEMLRHAFKGHDRSGRTLRNLGAGRVPLWLVISWTEEAARESAHPWRPGRALATLEELPGVHRMTLVVPTYEAWLLLQPRVAGFRRWDGARVERLPPGEPPDVSEDDVARAEACFLRRDLLTASRLASRSLSRIRDGVLRARCEALLGKCWLALRDPARGTASLRRSLEGAALPPEAAREAEVALLTGRPELYPLRWQKPQLAGVLELGKRLGVLADACLGCGDAHAAAEVHGYVLRALGAQMAATAAIGGPLDPEALGLAERTLELGEGAIASLEERSGERVAETALLRLAADAAAMRAALGRGGTRLSRFDAVVERALARDAEALTGPWTAGRLWLFAGLFDCFLTGDAQAARKFDKALRAFLRGRCRLEAACAAQLLGEVTASDEPVRLASRLVFRFFRLRDKVRAYEEEKEGGPAAPLGFPLVGSWKDWVASTFLT